MPALLKPNALLIATTNAHKAAEITAILKKIWPHTQFLSLKDVPHPPKVIENGTTFIENAVIKAKAYGEFSKTACLADDSGLCVDVLHGAPGIFSARYAGENATDQDNNQKLTKALSVFGKGPFPAHYTSALALYTPQALITAEGYAHGTIHLQAKGRNGFGYDPHFIPQGHTRSFAELREEEKNDISHRRVALENLIQKLKHLT